ncbi:MAG TPA: type VI secretion system-associated protein TagF [Steroidobacteraceae bacterium]
MTGSTIGWFGKLPSHGDFLHRRVPEAFINAWDPWLQQCMASSREQLGQDWLQTYLTSPVWRFFLSGGVVGASSFAGILLPSVDRVGRYFPLTVLAELPSDLPPMAVAIHGREWFRTIEGLALHALESEEFVLEDFDAAIQGSAATLAGVEQYYGIDLGQSFPQAADHWRLPLSSVDRAPAALIDPLLAAATRELRPLSMWWTDGSEHLGASCLLVKALPDSVRFTAMLDGQWSARGWSGEAGDVELVSAARFDYRVASAAITDTGPVRSMNQDRFLEHAESGIWVAADGMGGHSRGEYASQLVVDVIGSLEPAATVSASLQAARVVLSRANGDLVRSALGAGSQRSGSTVVVLCVRQQEWGVLWAGDSRAYLLRDGVLRVLTRDHAAGSETMDDFDDTNPAPSTGEITRAVGGHDELTPDRALGQILPADRFLLCSDGLHGAVDHLQLREILMREHEPRAAVEALLRAAVDSGTRDNVTAVVVDIVPET